MKVDIEIDLHDIQEEDLIEYSEQYLDMVREEDINYID